VGVVSAQPADTPPAFESRESAHFFMILIAYFMYNPTFFII